MAFHNDLGKLGEDIAAKFLIKKGCKILERNWKNGNYEIDIIAKDKNEIVFVEVKTRSDDSLVRPEDAVDYNKRRNLTIAANSYLNINNINLDTRFDVIAIILNTTKHEITHYEDAFFPVLRKKRY